MAAGDALSTDLVSRLRAKAAKGGVIPIGDMTIVAAADEIEQLRDTLARIARLDTATDEFGFACAKDMAQEALKEST